MADDVGEIVLALSILVINAVQPLLETGRGCSKEPGVDLADRLLCRARVFLFDNASHAAIRTTQNPAVASRIRQLAGQNSQPFTACRPHYLLQRLISDQGHVPVYDQDRSAVGDCRQRL